jgi:hypothetical protein
MMIPWRATGATRRDIEVRFGLAPVTFDPNVAAAMVVPVAFDPVGVGVGWFHVVSGNPDIAVVFPAVVAGVPGPVGVLVRWWRDDLNRARWWWTDANNDLGL